MRRLIFTLPLLLTACQPAEMPVQSLPESARADFILVDKSDRTMTIFADGAELKTYTGIGFGNAPTGHKQFEGDERTPEGRYTIDTRNPNSSFYLSLRISYPNAADRNFAAAQGRHPGGDIFIHGQPNWLSTADSGGRMSGDWTDGCIAVTNSEMDELWRAIADGTEIEIRR